MSHNHLSPWDLSGLGMGFGLYRPRRPSYTYATQTQRQRSESYRYAVRKSTTELDEPSDFIEGIIQMKNRKESYVRATRRDDPSEMEINFVSEKETSGDVASSASKPSGEPTMNNVSKKGAKHADKIPNNQTNHTDTNAQFSTKLNGAKNDANADISNTMTQNHIDELKSAVAKKRLSPIRSSPSSNHNSASQRNRRSVLLAIQDIDEELPDDSVFTSDQSGTENDAPTPSSVEFPQFPGVLTTFQFRKNLTLLCLSFILIFSAFRAIQNLQSSLNEADDLGIISMSFIHGTMSLTCLWAPVIINSFTAKWTLVGGTFSFITWTAANFYPRFYTLIPFGIIAGVGQGILWTAESSYILKLAFDASRSTKDLEREVFRFHGIFLACFQTTHIWGNLISSIVLHSAKSSYDEKTGSVQRPVSVNYSYGGMEGYEYGGEYMDAYMEYDSPELSSISCGVLYSCPKTSVTQDITKSVPSTLWKLMSAYLALGVVALFLIILCLDRIGAKVNPEKSGYEIVVQHVSLMIKHKTFRLLMPLLIFSGLQQAFIFTDFNQAYVTCAMGEEYIGYTMIILGLANVVSAILVAVCANLIPREVVFGLGGIIHMGLMIGLLIWIPERSLTIFFILAASWGLCDAVWQTQCNTLICITCPEETDIAFANYRMLQSVGLTIGFLSGTFLCVSFKLYILMILLVVAIMFYVLAEYRVRQVDGDVFEGQVEVN